MKTSELRQAFIDYFTSQDHTLVVSSPLVPDDDPTLLFTNAGMVQFKHVFLGTQTRPYRRAVSIQRCLRAGGKHNDLENVGYTARHHTFFEMLGNFSFGDYFKRDAIVYAWNFLTKVLKLPPERLWVTVYKDDQEAEDLWLKTMGVSPDRFSRCGEKDNFWSMGDTGPCGPCSEIFYDHGPHIAGGPPGSPDADGDRYVEIWNLVFMQFNRDASGVLHPLPQPSVDTGMGLERIAAVMQGVSNNYQTDLFAHLIQATNTLVLPGKVAPTVSLHVIADHIRACAFLILDGVRPSHEGRGYVLRRIMRRAIRHGHRCHLPTPFLARLIDPLIEMMGNAYPALCAQREEMMRVLTLEEQQFSKTLDQGLLLLQQEMQQHAGQMIPGHVAFKLYDTYGFPLDLTNDVAREKGLTVDEEGFEACMQKQRAMSQAASQFRVDYSTPMNLEARSKFCGYTEMTCETVVEAIVVEGQCVTQLEEGTRAGIVLRETPFYAQSGGQLGDQGQIVASGMLFHVDDTVQQGEAIIHEGILRQGTLKVQDDVHALIDVERRVAIQLNHTATHLVQAALKHVLGMHVQQRGSLVDAARARFDFSHAHAMSAAEITLVEDLVNAQIRANHAVMTEQMSLDEAKNSGAMALFDEKYSDKVRVLSMSDFSKELCGGTHAQRTGDLGLFKITAEYGVASGVRRMEWVSGAYAIDWVNDQLAQLQAAASVLKTSPMQVLEKLTQWSSEMKTQEKTLAQLQQKMTHQSSQALLDDFCLVNQVPLLIKRFDDLDLPGLRAVFDQLKSSKDAAVMVLYAVSGERMQVVAGVSPSLLARGVPAAPVFVRLLCGKGGGRDDMAQGGGAVPSDLEAQLRAIHDRVHNATQAS